MVAYSRRLIILMVCRFLYLFRVWLNLSGHDSKIFVCPTTKPVIVKGSLARAWPDHGHMGHNLWLTRVELTKSNYVTPGFFFSRIALGEKIRQKIKQETMKILTHFYKDIFQFFKIFFQYNCYKNVFHCRISGSHRVIWKVERS